MKTIPFDFTALKKVNQRLGKSSSFLQGPFKKFRQTMNKVSARVHHLLLPEWSAFIPVH